MPISDAVLRRRQLDLDKRTAELSEYFDLQTYDALKRMPQYWRGLDRDITSKMASLYKKIGATTDPNKLKALAGKLDRLTAFVTQIRADIDRYTYGFEAWTTGRLKQNFEKSYYMNAWAVEQAAKVTVNIPVLSPAQVLGVLCNPWLPDGHNYSRRIRANADLLAYEMKQIIESAVKMGTGWNEVARNISKATGESYFRAVRLARTEMTRVQALGASYSYLQNNDILEGKRWNATLDSRTATKDAANDGEIFDLEYDTVEYPGVPGKRIPNHPHCRCIWSPKLSSLGINDRERIARGDNDTATHFGDCSYTQAGTYREYAKERGLPDLDDRLANDTLSKYLRPGESIDDLKKLVKRFSLNGNTINVPEPYWQNPNKYTPIGKPKIVKAPKLATVTQKKVLPPIVENLRDKVKPYLGSVLTDSKRKKIARELLDECNLQHIPNHVIKTGNRGACALDYRSDPGIMHVTEYKLQANDDREDFYKIKTVFHELFHANMDGKANDLLTCGYSFDSWVDVEEVFTESAAHYLIHEAGINNIHPAYAKKLVNNLPRFKQQFPEFKNCNTIEDFGEIMVQYRLVDQKPSNWKQYIDVATKSYNPVPYVVTNFKDYIENNFDGIFSKVAENTPILLTDPDFKNQAWVAWEDAVNRGTLPIGGNKQSFFYDIAAAAMQAMGVK